MGPFFNILHGGEELAKVKQKGSDSSQKRASSHGIYPTSDQQPLFLTLIRKYTQMALSTFSSHPQAQKTIRR